MKKLMTKYTSEERAGCLGKKCPLTKTKCVFECAWFIGSTNYGKCVLFNIADSGVYDMLDEVRASINSVANNVER